MNGAVSFYEDPLAATTTSRPIPPPPLHATLPPTPTNSHTRIPFQNSHRRHAARALEDKAPIPSSNETIAPLHSAMPPKKRAPPGAADEYSSDGGFVANDSEEGRPRAKKVKTGKSASAGVGKGAKGVAVAVGGGGMREGEAVFWEVSVCGRAAFGVGGSLG